MQGLISNLALATKVLLAALPVYVQMFIKEVSQFVGIVATIQTLWPQEITVDFEFGLKIGLPIYVHARILFTMNNIKC